ncbi:MAG: M20 family metallopeptidase [Thermostichus sp. HHBFW_bins_43]
MPLPSLRPAVQALQPELVTWRRHIHKYPELGFREEQTAAYISQRLKSWGIPHQTGIAHTGIVAIIEGEQPGPTLALRADMDALPIEEANEVEYRSCLPNTMHACGHDGHTAIAMGTAKLLQQHRQHLRGRVKVIFQPAEEGPGGAKPMLEAGVLKNPDVEGILGLHLWNNRPLGSIGVKSGPSMAFADRFQIQVIGRGGHAAIPHQTVDAIVVGSQIVSALQTIVSRNVDPMLPAVVTVGRFRAGDAFNVIAPSAEIWGTVRSFHPEVAELIPKRIEEIVAGICQAHGATYEFQFERRYPAVHNDPAMTALVEKSVRQVFGSEAVIIPEMTMGGEDVSFFMNEVPGCYFFVGSANSEKGLDYPHHHPRFDFDEGALGIGVELFLRCIENYTGQALN